MPFPYLEGNAYILYPPSDGVDCFLYCWSALFSDLGYKITHPWQVGLPRIRRKGKDWEIHLAG